MKTKKIISLISCALLIGISISGCEKKESPCSMNALSIENNIAYNYVLSTDLSTTEGFAANLGVADSHTIDINGEIQASAAILVDITTGEVVLQKNPYLTLYPASTTKVLTGIVALENAELDKAAVIDESIYFNEDNVWICDFRIGDTLTLEQALNGAIINSGNDAASIVATTVAGNIPAFSELMNEKANKIGATNSHFANPHGLTNPEHYTTAYDLYLIFNEAIKNPKFVEIASTVEYKTTFTRKTYKINHSYTNGNRFINGMVTAPNNMKVICGKTGYTQAAGYCLVILSESPSGHRYISVILNAKSRDSMYNQMSYLLEKASER